MKIFNPNISGQNIGGGWTFRRNLEQALFTDVEFVNRWQDCDIYFITSVTIVDKREVFEASRDNKKIVLRVDNMPRKSRNGRLSPHERMREYAGLASAVVYQSKWALDWVGSYVGYPEKSRVIYNGVDTSVFYSNSRQEKDHKVFMYIQYNRDENKRMTEAFDMFSAEWMKNSKNKLWIVGNYSPEIIASNFDFFRGEDIYYWGIIDAPVRMAELMRQGDVLLYPSYSDALPNTVIEAHACGLDIRHHGHAGVAEACTIADPSLERMGKEYLDLFKSL